MRTTFQSSFPEKTKNMTIIATQPITTPPRWALLERQLIARMNASAEPLLKKYVRPDGSLLWPVSDDFSSIDGLDDAYESFHNWPLFYALGGADKFHEISLFEWDAITRQFERYDCGFGHPMVVKEYEQGYDWMHQGEGYLFFYLLGLAAPSSAKNIERAQRFAGFYLNEDAQAPNYDEKLKLVRCAFVGSMGPAHRNFDHVEWGYADWKTYYGLPFQDAPGCTSMDSIQDRANAIRMGETMRQRMAYGDVATNLAITGLLTNAFLYTGQEKYRAWVKEYVDTWMERAAENGGILPDNVGLSGKIGETMNGKWYGGYYGWTWPHGWAILGDAVTLAAENTLLLFRDPSYLDLPRSQMDALIQQGIESKGTLHVPHKYGDPGCYEYNLWAENVLSAEMRQRQEYRYNKLLWKDGWFEFMPMQARHSVHVWYLSLDEKDRARIETIRNYHTRNWEKVLDTHEKDQGGHEAAWAAYLNGEYPTYPEDILSYNLSQVEQRLAFMRDDTQDPKTYTDSYLQQRNPITLEGLVQLTLGGLLPLYNGGHLMAAVRYFDRQRRRPGLPEDVAALVEAIHPQGIKLRLVNLSPSQRRELTLQAGAYGEHRFTTVKVSGADQAQDIQSSSLAVDLPPATEICLEVGWQRFVNEPSFALP